MSIDEFETEIQYAITLVTDLAVLLLESKVNGRVNISELLEADDCIIGAASCFQVDDLNSEGVKIRSRNTIRADRKQQALGGCR